MRFEEQVYELDKRPKCQKDSEGIHIDEEEIIYGIDNDGVRREAVVLRCKNCGMRELIQVY